MPSFNPSRDIPDLSGKVILVTGGNSGLGYATIAELAVHRPHIIYMACRSSKKAQEAVITLQQTLDIPAGLVVPLELDLSSFESIKRAAHDFKSKETGLDLLYLNAGIGAPPHSTTKDDFEIQFGTNYLGHAMLTHLLMPCLLSAAEKEDSDVRVIALSSVGHKVFAPSSGIQYDKLSSPMDSFSGMALYGQSMLARTLFAHELAKRYPMLTVTSCHPGTVRTNITSGEKSSWLAQIMFKLLMATQGVSSKEGAKNQLWLGTASGVQSGKYYEPVGKEAGGKNSYNDDWATELWKWTDEVLKMHI